MLTIQGGDLKKKRVESEALFPPFLIFLLDRSYSL